MAVGDKKNRNGDNGDNGDNVIINNGVGVAGGSHRTSAARIERQGMFGALLNRNMI